MILDQIELELLLLKTVNLISGDARSGEEKVEDPSCKDLDNRCTNWVKRKGKEVCESKKYVQKKCIKSCDKCGAAEQETVVVEKPKKEVCKDKNENCGAWASRDGNLCGTHKFMIAKCRLTCGLCTKKGGVEGLSFLIYLVLLEYGIIIIEIIIMC